MTDLLITNATIASLCKGTAPYGVIEKGALAVTEGRLSFVGPLKRLPKTMRDRAARTFDVGNRLVTPALIDCHTHLVFADNRASEFELRLKGKSYAAIARQGGGILSTVAATRKAEVDELIFLAEKRARTLMSEGVGVIEIKSGYGLDYRNEIKILEAASVLRKRLPIKIIRTFLGAHALPPEYKHKRQDYLALLKNRILPVLVERKLVDMVDAYLETIAFSLAEVSELLSAAQTLGLAIRLHADQLSDMDGARLAAGFKAQAVDHLEYTNARGVRALGKAGTVAVLLPGSYLMLREKQKPPVELLRKHRVPMALATDCNPGTSPLLSLRLAMGLSCSLFGLTPEEALVGVTRNAAQALGLQNELGTLERGKVASLAVWDCTHPSELSYWLGGNLLDSLILEGNPIISS